MCVRAICLVNQHARFHLHGNSSALAVQALSQYYLLLLLPSKVQCINRINGQVKQELALPPSRALSAGPQTLALASDAAEGSLYLLSGVTVTLHTAFHAHGIVACLGHSLYMGLQHNSP